jgi:hypothetical protein
VEGCPPTLVDKTIYTPKKFGIGAILPALAQICTNSATRFRFSGNLKN